MVLRQNSCNLYHNGGYDSLTGDNKPTTTNNAMGNITSKTNLEMSLAKVKIDGKEVLSIRMVIR